MSKSIESAIYDLVGVGCGPSNLALAIALEERAKAQGELKALFIDKQANYQWHGNTITDQSGLQISFLKDLVSLRSPTSPYSFVNYLKEQGRLVDFINLGTFYPSRLEFSDYLRWVAGHFESQCRYSEEVMAIEPVLSQDKIKKLRVISCDTNGKESVRETRSLVVSPGGSPHIPELFQPLKVICVFFIIRSIYCVWLVSPVRKVKLCALLLLVGGQSAAEALIDLSDNYPSVKVDMILRSMSLKPADASPFVNEIFAPSFTDAVYGHNQAERDQLLNEYRHTNYSVVEEPMIKQIYSMFYKQKVSGDHRHTFRCSTVVEKVNATEKGIELALRKTASGDLSLNSYDAVILATGYERQQHRELLAPLSDYLGNYNVDRQYRVQTDKRCKAAIYLQGSNEATHGLSDTLLSVLAVRSDEIASSLYGHLNQVTHGTMPQSVKNQLTEVRV